MMKMLLLFVTISLASSERSRPRRADKSKLQTDYRRESQVPTGKERHLACTFLNFYIISHIHLLHWLWCIYVKMHWPQNTSDYLQMYQLTSSPSVPFAVCITSFKFFNFKSQIPFASLIVTINWKSASSLLIKSYLLPSTQPELRTNLQFCWKKSLNNTSVVAILFKVHFLSLYFTMLQGDQKRKRKSKSKWILGAVNRFIVKRNFILFNRDM